MSDVPTPGAAGDDGAPDDRAPDDAAPDDAAPDDRAPDDRAPDDGGGLAYHLNVDGTRRAVTGAWIGDSLLMVLRERLGVTSVKDACEQGRCGACSVLLDGRLVAACTVLAADAVDSRVVTVAGLGPGGPAAAVRAAFLAHGAVQCGFCTPGMVVAVTDLLGRRPMADEDEIREALAGNICRCTGYGRILEAVRAVQAGRGPRAEGGVIGPARTAPGGRGAVRGRRDSA